MATKRTGPAVSAISLGEYKALAEFRLVIRRYLAFAEVAAASAGLSPRQYQALLAITAAAPDEQFTVGLLADRMMILPHSALELARRLESGGYVRIVTDLADRRRRLLTITPSADKILEKLSSVHLAQLRQMVPSLADTLMKLSSVRHPS